nr:choice-of-anchor D domain-containing protein [Cohnella thailandensis]
MVGNDDVVNYQLYDTYHANNNFRSTLTSVLLEAGVTYTLVTTSFQANVTGSISFSIAGPDAVTLSENENSTGYTPPEPELSYSIEAIADVTLGELMAGYASGAQETKTITVKNTGTGDLTNLKAELSGDDAEAFELTQPTATLNGGASTSFTVKAVDGLAAGTYVATVTVSATNLTADETFTITQVVNDAPTYAIEAIEDVTATPLTAGYSTGDKQTKTITVKSTGTGTLTNLKADLSGDDAEAFELTQPTATLNGGASTSFTVKAVDGLAAGTYTATVTVSADNLTDETFTVTQKVNAAPTYTIEAIDDVTATPLTAGYDAGDKQTKTITVKSTGTGTLTNLKAELSGADAEAFELTQPTATLNGGASTSFTVKAVDGLAAGTYVATVTVSATNLTSETFTITQVVNDAPTYAIEAIDDVTATPLTAGYSTGDKQTKTITVKSTGTGTLTNLKAELSGDDAEAFELTQPTATLNGGASTSFTVKAVDGLAAGTYVATVTVSATNLTSETFTITQVVNDAPTYAIEAIEDVTATPLTAGYSTGDKQTKTITVKSTGTGTLTNLKADLSGADAEAFELTQPTATLNGGASTSFTVKAVDGLAAGTYVATVTVSATNLTADETFTITQVVNDAPTYAIEAIEDVTATPLTAGYDSGDKQTKTITVKSTGTGTLTNLKAELSGADAEAFELTQPTATLNGGASTSFTVEAVDGLAAGTYTATVTVSANNLTDETFTVTQVVNAAPTYAIETIADVTASELVAGYASSAKETKTITVKSTGTGTLTNLKAELSGADAEAFELTQPTATLNGGAGTSFTVKAVDGLAAGTYTATVTVSANNLTDETFTITQVVNAAPTPLTYTIKEIDDVTLTTLTEGYASGTQEKKKITVLNNGTGDLTNLSAALSGSGASNFVLTQPLDSSLASGEDTSLAVKAKDNLPAGTYTATVTVSANNLAEAETFTITQVVNAAPTSPTYTIEAIGDVTANELTAGYASGTQEAKKITVKNTGTGDLMNLKVELSGSGASAFELTQPLDSSLTSGEETSFKVKAKDNLPAGTYVATVTVSADHLTTDETFTITQKVNLPEVPASPQNLTATGGDRQVSLTWHPVDGASFYNIFMGTASGRYGSEPIATVTDAEANVPNLTNGTKYYFIVKAGNNGGLSSGSNEASATPATAPAAPNNVVATAGNGQAIVTFTAPNDNGGNVITGYVVTAMPGGITATGTASPITVNGLTNGTAYTFTVKALSLGGNSAESAASQPVTPWAPSGGNDGTPPPATDTNAPEASDSDVEVLVNGVVEKAGKASTTTVNGQTVTTVTVDQTKLDEKLATEGNGALVTVPIMTGADAVFAELNAQMIKNMELKQAVVELKTPNAAYKLPAQLINIDSISGQIGQAVSLQDIKIHIQIAVPSADTAEVLRNSAVQGNFGIIVQPLEFTITATYGGQTVDVNRFEAYVERTIAIPDGVDPSRITTGVVIEPDGTARHVPTKVEQRDGKYVAVINSLTNSTYSVVWHPVEFADVARHWAKDAVNDMGSRMVVEGTGNGMFSPDQKVTRAEFAAIIVRALGLKEEGGTSAFADVKASDWFAGAVNTAFAYGLIEGYNDGLFHPTDNITREQAMAILAEAISITGLQLTAPQQQEADKILLSFADAAQVSSWARADAAKALQAGIVTGKDGQKLAPQDDVTRAEVAVMVQRLLQTSGLI